ncbi:hypothetical protein [Burkholderia seminalis]|uniref:hypothetical protein n=1 Tax=Burkholderia seminalis TaxID=488731 RepID=UPI0015892BBD|nr:hypothetical protein [Burkholderia seminalis]MDN7586229.1 hypothetical protein [Burkholderia seminalis]
MRFIGRWIVPVRGEPERVRLRAGAITPLVAVAGEKIRFVPVREMKRNMNPFHSNELHRIALHRIPDDKSLTGELRRDSSGDGVICISRRTETRRAPIAFDPGRRRAATLSGMPERVPPEPFPR